jgi:hypothetical protein
VSSLLRLFHTPHFLANATLTVGAATSEISAWEALFWCNSYAHAGDDEKTIAIRQARALVLEDRLILLETLRWAN